MFNPKRLSLGVRLVLIFIGLIATEELFYIIFDGKQTEDLLFVVSCAAINISWILYELAVFFGKIEVRPLVPKESKPLIKPDEDAPLYQKLWYYTKVSAYLIWGFLIGFIVSS